MGVPAVQYRNAITPASTSRRTPAPIGGRRLLAPQIELPPPAFTGNWTTGRKALVVQAIGSGQISMPQARSDYDLTPEELMNWLLRYRRGGETELKTNIRDLRAIRTRERRPTGR